MQVQFLNVTFSLIFFEMKLNAKQLRAMKRKRGRKVERKGAKRAVNSGCKKRKEGAAKRKNNKVMSIELRLQKEERKG